MDRFSIVLTLPVGAALTGGLAILFLSFGLYGWIPLLIAAIVGFGASWPVSYWISRKVKRQDPHFDHTRAKEKESPTPDPSAKEV